jgi:cellulose synthase (UDP-forming)
VAPVDVFITVAGEPLRVVEETIRAAKAMDYPDFRVFVLNDGLVAGKDNWQEIETLASVLGVTCITRRRAGGHKAGNINHALQLTRAPFVAVFDADHVPHPDFLRQTMGYFADTKTGFVQTPQFYKNRDANAVATAAWEQQELFYGAICQGKDRVNATFLCGTNMVIRRAALEEVGGIREDNIAEDIITSLFLHRRGWNSVYVPTVLAEGLAPEDMYSYVRQQFRWARGSLEIVFRHNPLFWRELSWSQRIQYLASASYYLSGLVVLMNALLPLLFLFTGAVPLTVTTMALAAVFLPYIFATVYLLLFSSNFTYTFRALAFSMAAWPVHLQAFLATVLRRESGFQVTAKEAVAQNTTRIAMPHLVYVGAVLLGTGIALAREGLTASVVTNFSWAFFNIAVFVPFIYAALPAVWRGAVAPAAEPAVETEPATS